MTRYSQNRPACQQATHGNLAVARGTQSSIQGDAAVRTCFNIPDLDAVVGAACHKVLRGVVNCASPDGTVVAFEGS